MKTTLPRINPKTKEAVLNALTDEPQKCGEIAKKAGIPTATTSRILNECLLPNGEVIKVPNQYDSHPPFWKKA